MEIIQINLNHCEVAQDLLWHNMAESSCDLSIISEPYRIPSDDGLWVADKNKMAAICTSKRYPIQELIDDKHEGFVVAKINDIYFCSCYAPPRWKIDEFEKMLETLMNVVKHKKPIIIAGDFNAWSMEWGSTSTRPRGQSLLEAIARLDVCIANEGTQYTYQKNGNGSVIDVTFCSPTLTNNMNWRVTDEYSASDHHIIRYKLSMTKHCIIKKSRSEVRWKTKELNKDLLCEAFELATNNKSVLTPHELTNAVRDACDMSMPRKAKPNHRRKPAYWWNADIADKRTRCNKARRLSQRARTTTQRSMYRDLHKALRAELSYAIKTSKRIKFKELCEAINDNPWGLGYQTAMSKLKGSTTGRETNPEKLKKIVDTLFPMHRETSWAKSQHISPPSTMRKDIKLSDEELVITAKRLSLNKAPGPDGIPNEVLKALIMKFPEKFRETLQQCMDDCYFPDLWKKQKLVLIPKPSKMPGEPTAFRPLCLLDTLGKLLEAIIMKRLVTYSEGETGLSENQFGFRKRRSTLDAISLVVDRAKLAMESHTKYNRYCAIITIDVKNAFNSANWEFIVNAISKIGASEQICRMIKSYLTNRFLIYDTEIGPITRTVNAGVPQGSILGPLCWNIMYDSILRLKLPDKVEIVGFADDIVLTVIGDSMAEVNAKAEYANEITGEWLKENKLQRADQKTEMTVVTNRRQPITTQINIGGHVITSTRYLKYLGVIVDDRLNFNKHVDYACEKAARIHTALSRIMPNTFGPRSSKRRLLANVTMSVLRYGCEIWWKTTEKRRNWEILNQVHRLSAIRITSAYRTISFEAVSVISGLMPICILLREDSRCWTSKKASGVSERPSHREQSLIDWQTDWDRSKKGEWTHRLIPRIKPWLERTQGEIDYYLTQFLSGHGGFGKYLHRIGKVDSPLCIVCREEETPEHVLFKCMRFDEERRMMYLHINPSTKAENLIDNMCKSKSAWAATTEFMRKAMTKLEEERCEV